VQKKKKRIIQHRNMWGINPRTRVHDNDIKRNIKKQRREGKKAAKESGVDE